MMHEPPIPIDLATLDCHYTPCEPLDAGYGFVTVTWHGWAPLCPGTYAQAVLCLSPPVVLHHGVVQYEQILDLPVGVCLAIADAYRQWVCDQHHHTGKETT